jgi:general secretion pathway protein A
VRTPRPINAARALDPARVLDTEPPRPPTAPKSQAVAPAAPAAPPPAPPRFAPPDIVTDVVDETPAALTRPLTVDPRLRRPLLDLFPATALEPDGPPPDFARRPSRRPRGPRRRTPSPTKTFYGLREKPFSLSTDPRFWYQSEAHERAGQEILAAVRERGGPALLTAPLGMGKTTLCRALLHDFDRRIVASLVLEPLQSLDDLVKTMLVDFGVVSREQVAGGAHLSRERLIATLNTFLESLAPLQASAVVFVDEAQAVPVTLLGDLAAWLGGAAAGVVQLVLVGQPALTGLLLHDELRGLNASARRIELGPLAADEISGYVMHRLSIAGAHTRSNSRTLRLRGCSRGRADLRAS